MLLLLLHLCHVVVGGGRVVRGVPGVVAVRGLVDGVLAEREDRRGRGKLISWAILIPTRGFSNIKYIFLLVQRCYWSGAQSNDSWSEVWGYGSTERLTGGLI